VLLTTHDILKRVQKSVYETELTVMIMVILLCIEFHINSEQIVSEYGLQVQ